VAIVGYGRNFGRWVLIGRSGLLGHAFGGDIGTYSEILTSG
jgi:hypothetical protein